MHFVNFVNLKYQMYFSMVRFTRYFLNSSFLLFTINNVGLVRMVEEQERTEAVSSSEKETVGYFYLLLLHINTGTYDIFCALFGTLLHMTVCIPPICGQSLNKMIKCSLLVCFTCQSAQGVYYEM